MEIYPNLPYELQCIVKRYALCSPHKQSLLTENKRKYHYIQNMYVSLVECSNPMKSRYVTCGEVNSCGELNYCYFSHLGTDPAGWVVTGVYRGRYYSI